MVSSQDASPIAIKLSTSGIQEDAPKDEYQRHGDTVTASKDKRRIPREPVGPCNSDSISAELKLAAESPGPGFKNQTSDFLLVKGDEFEKSSSLNTEIDKQLVLYVPKPASKKKTSYLFGTIDMSKSLNSEPSASPRRSSSSLSRFFSRNKNLS